MQHYPASDPTDDAQSLGGSAQYATIPEWVLYHPDLDGEAIRLYGVIQRRINSDKLVAWPGQEYLMTKCHLAERTLRRAQARLVSAGILWVKRRGQGRTNFYWLCSVPDEQPPARLFGQSRNSLFGRSGSAGSAATGSAISAGQSRESDREIENESEKTRDPDPQLALVVQVFETWRDATGRSDRTVLDAPRTRLIAKALEAYPLEDVLDAVRGWKHSSFHRGDEGKVWNDLGLLLRNADHIEKFRDLWRGPSETRRRPRGAPPIDNVMTDRDTPSGVLSMEDIRP